MEIARVRKMDLPSWVWSWRTGGGFSGKKVAFYIYIYSELEDCLEMGFDIINNGSNLVCQVLIE